MNNSLGRKRSLENIVINYSGIKVTLNLPGMLTTISHKHLSLLSLFNWDVIVQQCCRFIK